jgi:hypothetical protein
LVLNQQKPIRWRLLPPDDGLLYFMADNKKSFILFCDQTHLFQELDDDEAGRLIKHIFRYVNDEDPEPPDRITKIAFEPIKQQLKRNLKDWEFKKNQKSEAGKKGMESRWAKHNEEKQSITNDNSVINPITNITVSVNDNVTVSDTVNENVNDNVIFIDEPKLKFQKPTQLEISNFLLEKYPDANIQGAINFAEKFWNSYENKDWKINKVKMKNWKLAISNWSETLQKDLFPTLQNQLKTKQQEFQDSKVGKLMQVSQEADELIRQMFKDKKENESANSN